ncbi:MAG TPA: cytochrome c maturation protein CcmE [Polyangiaceae bacterium]|jgi:cytochrome c-type biogenesis protein CcmE|nr:cytochrome c maturation protein CcmE [Polyangiaceae bacterium]
MSELDDDLKKALAESEAAAPARDAVAREPLPREGNDKKRNIGLLIGLLVMGGGILAFVLGQDSDKLVYSKQVHEVRGEPADRNLRVQGNLVHGTLVKRDKPCEFRFQIRDKDQPDGAPLEVHYAACIVPDTFRDVKGMDVEVTAEGKLSSEGHLEAKQIFAKCPSKYEMQQRQAAGEQSPHGGGKPEMFDTLSISGEGS